MNTLDFSVETINQMAEMAKQFLANASNGSDVKANLVANLQLSFVDMNVEEADNIASSIISGVDTFNANMNKLSDESVDTLYTACLGAIEGQPAQQQAQTLVGFITLLKTLDGAVIALDGSDASVQERMEEMRSEMMKELSDDITEAELALLKEQLREALAASCVSVAGDARIISILKGAAFDDEVIMAVADELANLDELKYYTALAAYILWKKGNVADIPDDASVELLAASVAAGVEKMKVVGQAKKGLIDWQTALCWIKRIGSALLLTLFAWVSIKLAGAIAVLGIVGAVLLLDSAVFGTIAGLIIGFVISCKAIQWMYNQIPDAIIDNFTEMVEEVYNMLKPVIKISIKHLEDFWHYLKEKGNVIFKTILPTNDVIISSQQLKGCGQA